MWGWRICRNVLPDSRKHKSHSRSNRQLGKYFRCRCTAVSHSFRRSYFLFNSVCFAWVFVCSPGVEEWVAALSVGEGEKTGQIILLLRVDERVFLFIVREGFIIIVSGSYNYKLVWCGFVWMHLWLIAFLKRHKFCACISFINILFIYVWCTKEGAAKGTDDNKN